VQAFHGSIEGSMKNLRALATRVMRIRPHVLTTRAIHAHAPSSARERRHTFVVWVEDHAERLILTTLVILFAAIGTLLLWKTARVISLAREFQPVPGVIAALTTISFGLLNVLKGRRDRRLKESGSRQQVPVAGVTPAIAENPALEQEPDETAPQLREDVLGNSA
jgi:hypothetical protein